MKYIFTITFIIFTQLINAQNSCKYIENSDVKSDFEYLYKSLQETHYNLFAYTSKKDYDSVYFALKTSITKDSLSLIETTSLFQELVSFSNTGHCEIDFPISPYIKYAQNNGTVFPLELAFENNKVFIRKNMSSDKSIIIGDEILAIDGKPITDIQKELYPFVSAEREYFKNAKIEFYSFPRLFYQLNGKKDNWHIQIKNAENETININLSAITVMDYESNRNGEVVNSQKLFKQFDNVAYINPGPFSSIETNGEILFKQFVDSVFADIRTKRTKHLIIDLRNNPGGHNADSDYLISYIANKPFKWYSAFSLKTSKLLKYHTRLQADTTDNYSKSILTNLDGKIFKYDFPIYQPIKESNRFKGKVYVLINRQTYSMAAESAAIIQDYKFGEIVGEETGDVPTIYASQFSFQLPETSIIVKVPKSYIVRPNGDKSLNGVIPDIEIKDHLLDENDEILNELLKRI